MAILSSDKRFEITKISFAPNVIVFGEETNYSITIKNKSNVKITKLCIRLSYAYPTKTHWSTTGYIDIFGELKTDSGFIEVVGATNWANNTEKTFTGKVTFNAGNTPPYFEGRAIPELDLYGLSAQLYFHDDMSVFTHIDSGGVLYMIDAHYSPKIAVFDAVRSFGTEPNDEGENVLTDIKLLCSEATRREYLSLYFNYRSRDNTESDPISVNITNLIDSALADRIQHVIDHTLNKNSDWDLVLYFGDQYEFFTISLSLPRSFANVHLSGLPTGGVCFGGFDKSTMNNPKFRSYYPAEFVGGIEGVTNYVDGEVETGGLWIPDPETKKREKIYRYVFVGESSLDGAGGVIGKLPSKIGNLISTSGTMKSSDGSFRPIPYSYYGNLNWSACYYVDGNGSINLQIGSNYSGKHTIIIIFEYTKLAEEVSE